MHHGCTAEMYIITELIDVTLDLTVLAMCSKCNVWIMSLLIILVYLFKKYEKKALQKNCVKIVYKANVNKAKLDVNKV